MSHNQPKDQTHQSHPPPGLLHTLRWHYRLVYLQEGEVRVSMKVCNLQVAMNDLAARVKQPQGLVMIFLAGGQGQLHVSTQTHCNTENI